MNAQKKKLESYIVYTRARMHTHRELATDRPNDQPTDCL